MIEALIVEDLPEVGRWIKRLIVSAFSNAQAHHFATLDEARAFIRRNPVGLALIDINLPDGNGIDFIADVRSCCPDAYVVMITIYDDPEHLFPAIRAGADGYLLKDQSEELLIDKLRGILKGDPPLSPGIARKILEHFQQSGEDLALQEAEAVNLTPREEDVLVLVAQGHSRKEIARILNLSIHTVGRYIKDLYRKLEVTSRAEAAIVACRMGLIRVK